MKTPQLATINADDDDDWIDIENPSKGDALPEVYVVVFKKCPEKTARARIVFRRDAAKWLAGATRHRVQIGGQFANKLRLVADDVRGREHRALGRNDGATQQIVLGIVAAWPNEARAATPCAIEITPAALTLTLPIDFARPLATAPGSKPSADHSARPPKILPSKTMQAIASERDELAETVRQSREAEKQKIGAIPEKIGASKFTSTEREMLAVLMSREKATKAALLAATAQPGIDDERDEKMVDVVICKMRSKLKPIGIEINKHWGDGYSISRAQRQALKQIFEGNAA